MFCCNTYRIVKFRSACKQDRRAVPVNLLPADLLQRRRQRRIHRQQGVGEMKAFRNTPASRGGPAPAAPYASEIGAVKIAAAVEEDLRAPFER